MSFKNDPGDERQTSNRIVAFIRPLQRDPNRTIYREVRTRKSAPIENGEIYVRRPIMEKHRVRKVVSAREVRGNYIYGDESDSETDDSVDSRVYGNNRRIVREVTVRQNIERPSLQRNRIVRSQGTREYIQPKITHRPSTREFTRPKGEYIMYPSKRATLQRKSETESESSSSGDDDDDDDSIESIKRRIVTRSVPVSRENSLRESIRPIPKMEGRKLLRLVPARESLNEKKQLSASLPPAYVNREGKTFIKSDNNSIRLSDSKSARSEARTTRAFGLNSLVRRNQSYSGRGLRPMVKRRNSYTSDSSVSSSSGSSDSSESDDSGSSQDSDSSMSTIKGNNSSRSAQTGRLHLDYAKLLQSNEEQKKYEREKKKHKEENQIIRLVQKEVNKPHPKDKKPKRIKVYPCGCTTPPLGRVPVYPYDIDEDGTTPMNIDKTPKELSNSAKLKTSQTVNQDIKEQVRITQEQQKISNKRTKLEVWREGEYLDQLYNEEQEVRNCPSPATFEKPIRPPRIFRTKDIDKPDNIVVRPNYDEDFEKMYPKPKSKGCQMVYYIDLTKPVEKVEPKPFDVFERKIVPQPKKQYEGLVKVGGGWNTMNDYMERHAPVKKFEYNRDPNGVTKLPTSKKKFYGFHSTYKQPRSKANRTL